MFHAFVKLNRGFLCEEDFKLSSETGICKGVFAIEDVSARQILLIYNTFSITNC